MAASQKAYPAWVVEHLVLASAFWPKRYLPAIPLARVFGGLT